MSERYERELRDVFKGELDTIDKLAKTMDDTSAGMYYWLNEFPFYVLRGAGSLGIDILAIRERVYIPIEVKSGKGDTKYFGEYEREQADKYVEFSDKCSMPVLYGYRQKGRHGEKYSLFGIITEATDIVFPFVPKIRRTKQGNRILRFDDGILLSSFLEKLEGW